MRSYRNRRYLLFTLGLPLVLFFLIAGPQRGDHDLGGVRHLRSRLLHGRARRVRDDERSMLSTGARIAMERAAGWNRQLRLTPLSRARTSVEGRDRLPHLALTLGGSSRRRDARRPAARA